MALTRNKKAEILERLQELAKKDSIVFLNFHGLPVAETTAMRSKLREANVEYFVAKKSLIKKAFENKDISGELPSLDGELAMTWTDGDDITGPAREVYEFQKKHDGNISILGGVFEKTYKNKAGMEEIALIPSLHTLHGMFVNLINSPIQGFALVIKGYADKKGA